MCGRFTQMYSWQEVHEFLDFSGDVWDYQPNYNVAPTQEVAVVRETSSGRCLGPLRWGLIPFWARDPAIGNRLINARSETVAEKPSFKAAFKTRRCVIPASGFYEWKKEGTQKQPYAISLDGERPMWFAGLWESWKVRDVVLPPAYREFEEGSTLQTFVIITTEANEALKFLHDRMPLMLELEEVDDWLNGRPVELDPFPPDNFVFWPVTKRVNSPANNTPENLRPIEL